MEPDMVEVTSPPIDLRAGINQTIIEQAKHDPHNMAYLVSHLFNRRAELMQTRLGSSS